MARPPIPPALQEQVIRLFDQGLNVNQAAEGAGVSYTAARNALRRAGRSLKHPKPAMPKPSKVAKAFVPRIRNIPVVHILRAQEEYRGALEHDEATGEKTAHDLKMSFVGRFNAPWKEINNFVEGQGVFRIYPGMLDKMREDADVLDAATSTASTLPEPSTEDLQVFVDEVATTLRLLEAGDVATGIERLRELLEAIKEEV